jgi:hypothetical protein
MKTKFLLMIFASLVFTTGPSHAVLLTGVWEEPDPLLAPHTIRLDSVDAVEDPSSHSLPACDIDSLFCAGFGSDTLEYGEDVDPSTPTPTTLRFQGTDFSLPGPGGTTSEVVIGELFWTNTPILCSTCAPAVHWEIPFKLHVIDPDGVLDTSERFTGTLTTTLNTPTVCPEDVLDGGPPCDDFIDLPRLLMNHYRIPEGAINDHSVQITATIEASEVIPDSILSTSSVTSSHSFLATITGFSFGKVTLGPGTVLTIPVPEPSTFVLFIASFGVLIATHRKP